MKNTAIILALLLSGCTSSMEMFTHACIGSDTEDCIALDVDYTTWVDSGTNGVTYCLVIDQDAVSEIDTTSAPAPVAIGPKITSACDDSRRCGQLCTADLNLDGKGPVSHWMVACDPTTAETVAVTCPEAQ